MAESLPNHVVNPESGFLESPAYADAFDTARKVKFLEVFKRNGMGLIRTCQALGISKNTVHKHYKIDPAFKKAYDEALEEYVDELEAVSRSNALNPKSVIERIFQLKALAPAKYDRQNDRQTGIVVNLSLDGKLVDSLKQRAQVLDAELVKPDALPEGVDPESSL